jgi:acyl-CoA synthetase (AMP-forming)/AMP-acid ligase II
MNPKRAEQYRHDGWWSDQRIFDLFDAAAKARPDAVAVVDPPNRPALIGGAQLRPSFAQLDRLAFSLAAQLSALGLRAGDVLVTQLPNVVEYVAVYLAALRLGVIVSPVPMQFRRREIEQIARLTEAKAYLSVARFRDADPFVEARAGLESLGTRLLALGGGGTPGVQDLDTSIPAAGDPLPAGVVAAARAVSSDAIATICWTSGTEGTPKGVPRTHNHWLAISHAHFEAAGIRPGDVLLNPFPLVNMAALGGCFLSWLRCGGTLVLHHPLDLPVYLAQIASERPDYAIAPPAVLNMLLKDEKLLASTNLSSLRCIGSGSAPLDPGMIRGFAERFGIEVVNIFGSNEGVSLLSGALEAPDPAQRARLFPRFGRTEIEWARKVARAIETRIVDPETGREILEAGRPGEMQIRGPTVFDGYFRAPQSNATAFTPDGWFRTGDLFEIAGEGPLPRYYAFCGRLKQLIVRGGVKISPEEIEGLLALHPGIVEASVLAFRDPILGERICAVVVQRPGAAPVTLQSIQELFRAQGVAVFKWPERLRFVGALPRNAVGKVVRGELASIAERPD